MGLDLRTMFAPSPAAHPAPQQDPRHGRAEDHDITHGGNLHGTPPVPAITPEVAQMAATLGQYGAPLITNLQDVRDLLASIRQFVQIEAERTSPANITHIDRSGLTDALGNCILELGHTPQGFQDRLERLVIQNPTGTDAWVFRNLPTSPGPDGFSATSLGIVPIVHLIDYVSSANPVATIDQDSLPVFYPGDRLTVVTRGGTAAGQQVMARATLRRSRS